MPDFVFRVGEGEAITTSAAPIRSVPARSLSDSEVQRLLDRLPLEKAMETDEQPPFAYPAESLPVPKAGRTIKKPFPAEDDECPVPELPSKELEIVRYSPKGDAFAAFQLSVTFSRPMTSLSGRDEMSARVPVHLEPLPQGRWQWLGTKTIVFQPEGRFPISTRFEAVIPEGTESADGLRLGKETSWSFTTSTVTIVDHHPVKGPQSRMPIIFMSFDQKIEANTLLDSVQVKAKGRSLGIRLADQEEIDSDPKVKKRVERAENQHWAALCPTEELPYNEEITVILKKGAPSAEGPLITPEDQSFTFRTFGRFKIREHGCRWGKNCPPLAPWYIRFSNPIDEDSFDPVQIVIEPEIPGVQFEVHGWDLTIKGRTKGRTQYRITVKKDLKDLFGQNLHKEESVTIEVGSAEPRLWAPSGEFVVPDPSGPPCYFVYSINYIKLRVRLFRVGVEHYYKFEQFVREYRRSKEEPPGHLISDDVIDVKADPDELAETAINFDAALEDGLGHVVLYVEPVLGLVDGVKTDQDHIPRVKAWIQSTKIGLDAFSDKKNLVAWVNSLYDGSNLPGIKVRMFPNGPEGISDEYGLCRFDLPDRQKNGPTLLVAEFGKDTAFIRQNRYYFNPAGWSAEAYSDSLHWYVVDDRRMYRPGETVKVKGWIRRIGGGPYGDVGLPDPTVRLVSYQLIDPRGNELAKGKVKANVFSGFDLSLDLPENINLGDAYLKLDVSGAEEAVKGREYTHAFQVQEFRRPEFEVNTQADPGPYMVGGRANVEVKASYYAGGGLPNAEVKWHVTASEGHFIPPGWSGFIFGHRRPWIWVFFSSFDLGSKKSDPENVESFTGRTDGSGIHRLRIDFDSMTTPRPQSITAQATVMDVNRQAWTSSQALLVHPSDTYVGLKPYRTFVQAREPFKLEVAAVDLDGNPAPGRTIHLKAIRCEYMWKQGSYKVEETEVQAISIESRDEPVVYEFVFDRGGEYRVSASVEDASGRPNESQFICWAAGGTMPLATNVEQEKVMLVPDKEEYLPGETAEVLIQAPFHPAEGLMTHRRSGILYTEPFRMEGPSQIIRVPIEEKHIPNVHLQVDLVGGAPRPDKDGRPDHTLPSRPAFAKGELNLKVPPRTRTLALDVVPRQSKLEPGGETVVDIRLSDADENPVSGAEVALAMVDEAVLALTGYSWPDPVSLFYKERNPDVTDYHSREDIQLARPETIEPDILEDAESLEFSLAEPMSRDMGGMMLRSSASKALEDEAPPPIALRTDFSALALFSPEVRTDRDGLARVPVKLPDNLTRYRIMAAAVAGENHFGIGESVITARLPLMVRPSPPRFLNFGDKFELPVVIQNQSENPLSVRLAIRAMNIELTDGAGREVTVPAEDRVEVRLPAGTKSAGTASFAVAAEADGWADAARGSLPVWTPASTEATAVYGEIDQGAEAQPIASPADVFPEFGGLEISTSSTALGALTDAFLYLVSYSFDCSEQIASRTLSIVALSDVLAAFKTQNLPSKSKLTGMVQRDIARLRGMQNRDGGFPVWREGQASWPYHSIHCAHALARARGKGYQAPDETWSRCLNYLKKIKSHFPTQYTPEARDALEAYALYVRRHMGDRDIKAARKLIDHSDLDNLHPETAGWLLYVLSGDKGSARQVRKIHTFLGNRVSETAETANFITDYSDGRHVLLHSNRRTDGIILEAMIEDRPKHDLIPKLVKGLLAHRRKGRWANTQENVFILLALRQYFETYEAVTPDFAARVWLGEKYAGKSEFKGRSADRHLIQVPMSIVQAGGVRQVVIDKEGPGRLYYRLGLDYAPKNLWLEPLDHGFFVDRLYQAVDDPEDVVKTEHGWRVRAGAKVRVNLTIVAPSRRYHMALVDPLPAGFEALNPALAVTGEIPADDPNTSAPLHRWWRPWYEHQNLRDHRAEAFATLLRDGVYVYSYLVRATTPGTFIVPPAKAEEMYSPETFGRSGTERVMVVNA